jgi:hypothetical protein
MTATMNQTIQPQFRTIDGLSIRFAPGGLKRSLSA